jgi:hypothetical protein
MLRHYTAHVQHEGSSTSNSAHRRGEYATHTRADTFDAQQLLSYHQMPHDARMHTARSDDMIINHNHVNYASTSGAAAKVGVSASLDAVCGAHVVQLSVSSTRVNHEFIVGPNYRPPNIWTCWRR